jgi:hypothetical protein
MRELATGPFCHKEMSDWLFKEISEAFDKDWTGRCRFHARPGRTGRMGPTGTK